MGAITDERLTEPQRAALRKLYEAKLAGQSPTRKELADSLGCSAPNAQKLVVALAGKGFLRLSSGKARHIEIVYAKALPALFLADASDVIEDHGTARTIAKRTGIGVDICESVLTAYQKWTDEQSERSVKAASITAG
jgi:SOS-response transcriptional repressor LexA